MQRWWIRARDAFDIIAEDGSGQASVAICGRAAEGLLRTRAALFSIKAERRENVLLPTEFWWAKGHAALEQNWETGDFSTWIEQTHELRAFGVEFDFFGLKQMLSPARAADIARRLSVVSNPDWISARGARQFAWENLDVNPTAAGDSVLHYVTLGFVPGRAVLMQRSAKQASEWYSEEREWDIPDWFWENFLTKGSSAQDWAQGKFSGIGSAPNGRCAITLTGVHFSSSALRDLASPTKSNLPTPTPPNKGGRPPKEWWDDLWCAMWGEVYRGDFKPKSQADIERAMMDWVLARDESVSESTLKPLARRMLTELER
jgi:hypothetical protein